jgi:hypothetical protein
MENRATAELINIIRTLFYNKSDVDERDRLIKRIETEFVDCDGRIDMYIRSSSKDLSRLIKVFNDVSRKIEHSRTAVANSREALKQCKILLQSKRDDVRRLLLEWWEQKYFAENVSKLKDLYSTPDQIRTLYLNKQYYEAAKLISESSKLLENEYREVTGLHELKRQIDDERIKLEKYLYQELSDQLYTAVRRSILESASSGLTREVSFKRRFRVYRNDETTNLNANNDDLNNDLGTDSQSIIELIVKSALNLNNLELNMNILEKMINDINKNISNELINMIHLTSSHVLESNLIDNKGFNRTRNLIQAVANQYSENNPKLLNQLIELAFEQFKITARFYRTFINYASKESQVKYQSGLVWMCIQNVLIQLLEEYLDIKQANLISDNDRIIDINAYFLRKRLLNLPFGGSSGGGDNQSAQSSSGGDGDGSNRKIFTFKGSSHSMNINQYLKEKTNESFFSQSPPQAPQQHLNDTSNDDDQRVFKVLVCQPSHRNVTTIFSLMEHTIKEISDEIRNLPNSEGHKPELSLEKFLQDFILNTFITNAVESITENANLSSTTGKFEISKQLISLAKQRELNLNKPILQSAWLVYECCYDLFNLMKDMSSYASEFAKAMLTLIEKHVDHCIKLYISIVKIQSLTGNDQILSQQQQQQQQQQLQQQKDVFGNLQDYVYSMSWVQDDCINKYFKQLPAFSAAIKGKSLVLNQKLVSTTVNLAAIAASNEVQQINYDILIKEVDTLISNLSERELDEIDIITNYHHIEMLAHLHESCDWLIVQLRQILGSIEQMIKNPKSLNNSLSIGELSKLVRQVDELDKLRGNSLLLLYLETRLHCFYHLIQFIKQENNTTYSADIDTDPDEAVLNMNRDLHRIHEHLSRSLQEIKVNYVFDALGFMIATIFIRALKNFKKISAHGIAKMCRNIFHVEQNLSAIRTKSDPHLMKAHRFYELLYKKPEELLNHLQEHEAEFQLTDYTNLLNLIYRSQPGYEINSLSDNLQTLANILKRKH